MSHSPVILAANIQLEPPENIDQALWRYLYENFAILRHAVLAPYNLQTSQTVVNTAVETEIFNLGFYHNDLIAFTTGLITLSGAFSTAIAAHTFTLRFYLDATLLHTLAKPSGIGTSTNEGWMAQYHCSIRTDGVSGDFVDFAVLFAATGGIVSSSEPSVHVIDTTVEHNFRVTVQWSNANAGTKITINQANYQNLGGLPS